MEPLQPGDPTRVGRYRLGGRLGRGGMGQVFWGRSPSGRPVAVKIVHANLAAQPEFRKRFAHEVDAARRVGGFHTAPVVDADPDGDPPWLVTAYVPAPSLADALDRIGRLAVPTLRTLGAGLAEALEAIHSAGLVHRDLKPANILMAEDGPRVIDFGIARAFDMEGLTATGASVGTPRFMSPEQFGGDQPITGASDVFAWGTVMCYAAGVHPFGDGSAATVVGGILLRPPALAGVPAPLLDVVTRSLAKEPARRPTPAQLLDELSDGSTSAGWLPPAVRGMLTERVLPDERYAEAPTQDIAGETTVRLDPPARPTGTRVLTPPPSTPVQPVRSRYPPPPPPRRSSGPPARKGLIAALVIAAVLIVGAVTAAYAFSAPRTSVADAPTTSEPAVEQSAQPASTGSEAVTPPARGIVGTWEASPSDGSRVTVTISPEGGSTYTVSLAVDNATYCNGATVALSTSATLDGDALPITWQVTCPDATAPLSPYEERYTYDATTDALSDVAGNGYRRAA